MFTASVPIPAHPQLPTHLSNFTVLTESATDVLSHVAIRARSQNVLLATCFDDDVYKGFEALQVGGRVDGTGWH